MAVLTNWEQDFRADWYAQWTAVTPTIPITTQPDLEKERLSYKNKQSVLFEWGERRPTGYSAVPPFFPNNGEQDFIFRILIPAGNRIEYTIQRDLAHARMQAFFAAYVLPGSFAPCPIANNIKVISIDAPIIANDHNVEFIIRGKIIFAGW